MSGDPVDRRDFLKKASASAASAAVSGAPTVKAPAASRRAAKDAPLPRRQFSLAYLTLFGCPPPEMTYVAARAGYDFVSLRPIFMGLAGEPNFDLAANPQMLRQTRTALSSTGLRVLDIELARIQDGVDPKRYLPAMEVSAELGARHVISSIWTDDSAFATDCYARLCDMAKPLKMTVDLEFVAFASVKTLQAALAVLRATRQENCGLLVDMLHFSRARVQVAELDAVPREWFHFTHLCDAPAAIPTTNEVMIRAAREDRLYLGEGGIDVAAILKHIPSRVHSIELPNAARAKEIGPAEHACRCLRTAREYLAAHEV